MVISVWLVSFSLDQRRVHYGMYADGDMSLSSLPEVLYGFGQQKWDHLDADGAVTLFRQVVARDPLHMDAWLKLAEAESETGNVNIARKIVVFCDARAGQVLRWKQAHTLLAHDLDEEDIFRKNLNYLVDRKKWLGDLFFLLDTHTKNQTDQAISLLAPANRPAYLEWLIQWEKVAAAQTVWAAIAAGGGVTDALLENYVHFLVSQKRMVTATALWQQHAGKFGMTNPNFEKEISGKGFGWRMHVSKEEKAWQGRRVFGQSHQGAHALQISFYGRENLDWHPIYQVVPVTPEKPHQLTFWWKSKGITTDQGPFVEIYGYDADGLYQKSPMVLGSRDWSQEKVTFTPPANCHAVIVQLCRNESLRFDNKIRGVLWVDDFSIQRQEPENVRSGSVPDS
jgi:hypothetical protein